MVPQGIQISKRIDLTLVEGNSQFQGNGTLRKSLGSGAIEIRSTNRSVPSDLLGFAWDLYVFGKRDNLK